MAFLVPREFLLELNGTESVVAGVSFQEWKKNYDKNCQSVLQGSLTEAAPLKRPYGFDSNMARGN